MICITGAGETVGTEVVKQLELANVPFRVAYFSQEKMEAALAKGMDAVIIDYNYPDTLHAAFQGCEKLFIFGPNALNQTELELNAIAAAKAVGSQHIVKPSVMGAEAEDSSLTLVHRPVEKVIKASGIE